MLEVVTDGLLCCVGVLRRRVIPYTGTPVLVMLCDGKNTFEFADQRSYFCRNCGTRLLHTTPVRTLLQTNACVF